MKTFGFGPLMAIALMKERARYETEHWQNYTNDPRKPSGKDRGKIKKARKQKHRSKKP